ncbi:MerR family transcriptional regulator, partial [Streptomyces sp. NPDC006356]
MKIGDLSRRTGVPTRLLRYYEEQDLLHPARTDNGYRDYAESAVQDVQQIRGLLDSGLTTEMIRAILPYLSGPDEIFLPAEHLTPETAALLQGHVDRIQ